MSNDLTKRTDPTKPERQKSNDAASRLKRELMADALDRLFGADESIDAPDKSKPPRVILALANHAHSRRLGPRQGTAARRCSRRQPAAAWR